jgi:dolichol kinase
MTPEDRRQLVHAAMTLFVVPLRWLSPAWAAGLAAAAVVLNWVVLPVTGLDRGMRREGGPWVDGAKLYPVAVLGLLLVWRDAPWTAAAAWAVLGIGDAASNVVGRRVGRPPFLGRADRSLAGTGAFVVTAFPAALAAHAWVLRAPPTPGVIVALGAAAAAGAAAELLVPRGWDDNVAIAFAAGATAHALS